MKIDGVDFWQGNHHVVNMWDEIDRVGPAIVFIDEQVRVAQDFVIFIKSNLPSLYHLLHRQSDKKHECYIFVSVEDKKTEEDMYQVLIRTTLKNIKFNESDYISESLELFITYHCLEIEDKTNYAT